MKNSLVSLSAIVIFVATVSCALGQAGSLDITFNPGTGANELVGCIGVQTNGQILIGGNFGSLNGTTRHYIARLNADGGVDNSFDPGDGPNALVISLTIQPDGKVLIGGTFNFVNGLYRPGIARLRADGSVDLTFTPGTGASGSVASMAVLTNAQILIAGDFSGYTGTNRSGVARLNSNGSLDLTFDPGSGASGGPVLCAAVQTDGKVLVGGNFSTFNGTPRKYIARLNADGSLDDGFIPDPIIGNGSYAIRCMAVQPDGAILIGGSFQTINGYTRHSVARLNADGTLDLAFNPGSGVNGSVFAMRLQADAKAVVSGTFTGVNGVTQNGIARLNGDGSLDTTFSSGSGANSPDVLAVALQADGKVLIGGYFSRFNGTDINRIARLNGDGSPLAGLQFLNANRYFGGYLSGTVSNTYRVEWTTNLNTPSLWTPLFNLTLQTNPQFILDPTPISGRERYYRAVSLP